MYTSKPVTGFNKFTESNNFWEYTTIRYVFKLSSLVTVFTMLCLSVNQSVCLWLYSLITAAICYPWSGWMMSTWSPGWKSCMCCWNLLKDRRFRMNMMKIIKTADEDDFELLFEIYHQWIFMYFCYSLQEVLSVLTSSVCLLLSEDNDLAT